MSTLPEELPDPVEREASHWVMQLRQGRLSTEQRQAFARWHAAAPEHAEAFERLDKAWSATAALRGRPGFERPARPVRGHTAWLPRGWRFAGACALLLGICLMQFWPLAGPGTTTAYRTATGEIRRIELPDGSQVQLGAATTLELAYDTGTRLVRLRQGEAIFTPRALDATEQRPFSVETAGARLTALGTRYWVENTGEDSGSLAVLQHEVRVELASRPGQAQVVEEGGAIAFDAAGLRQLERTGEELTSWSEGVLVFQRQPLASIVERLERYRPGRILIARPSLREAPLSAVVRLDGIEQAPRRLATELGASLLELPGISLIY